MTTEQNQPTTKDQSGQQAGEIEKLSNSRERQVGSDLLSLEEKEAIRKYFSKLLVFPGVAIALVSFSLGFVVDGSVKIAEQSAYNNAIERLVEPTSQAMASASAAEQVRKDLLDLRSEMRVLVETNKSLDATSSLVDDVAESLSGNDDFAHRILSSLGGEDQLLSSRMDTVCAAINNLFDFGRAYEMSNPNTCDAVCAASEEDSKECADGVLVNSAEERFARIECDYNQSIDRQYFNDGARTFCCCH